MVKINLKQKNEKYYKKFLHNIFVVKIFLQRYLVLCIKKHFFYTEFKNFLG